MKLLIIFCFLNLIFFRSYCQEEIPENKYFKLKDKKSYTATVNNKWIGYIISINDSTIITTFHENSYGKLSSGKATPYPEIDLLTIKQEGGGGKRVLGGFIVGITAGGIIGAATYSKPKPVPCTSCIGGGVGSFGGAGGSAFFGSLIGGVSGAIFGALIGSSKHKYVINKRKENFERMKQYLIRN